jgi:hypothetical protein
MMDAVVHPMNNGGGWTCEGEAACEEEEEEGARPIAAAAIAIVFLAE